MQFVYPDQQLHYWGAHVASVNADIVVSITQYANRTLVARRSLPVPGTITGFVGFRSATPFDAVWLETSSNQTFVISQVDWCSNSIDNPTSG